jgi:hypothetical protein
MGLSLLKYPNFTIKLVNIWANTPLILKIEELTPKKCEKLAEFSLIG